MGFEPKPEAGDVWVGAVVVVEAELVAWKGVVKPVKPEVWKEPEVAAL